MTREADCTGQSPAEVRRRVRGYIDEIAADYAYPVLRAMELGLDWFLAASMTASRCGISITWNRSATTAAWCTCPATARIWTA